MQYKYLTKTLCRWNSLIRGVYDKLKRDSMGRKMTFFTRLRVLWKQGWACSFLKETAGEDSTGASQLGTYPEAFVVSQLAQEAVYTQALKASCPHCRGCPNHMAIILPWEKALSPLPLAAVATHRKTVRALCILEKCGVTVALRWRHSAGMGKTQLIIPAVRLASLLNAQWWQTSS